MSDNPNIAGGRPSPRDDFFSALTVAIDTGRFVRLSLGHYRGGANDLNRVIVRCIDLRGERVLSFTYEYQQRVETRNHPIPGGLAVLQQEIGTAFRVAQCELTDQSLRLVFSRKAKATLQRQRQSEALNTAPPTHDIPKHRFISPALLFWHDLGVTTQLGVVKPAMSDKWRQVDKFIEIVDDCVTRPDAGLTPPIALVDYGCGKGYLTFAAHAHLSERWPGAVETTGVERRPELVNSGNAIAQRRKMAGLRFVEGDIHAHKPGAIHILVALHACDTATDQALFQGIRARAPLILTSPCCHKELRPQLTPPPVLQPLLRYGLHAGAEAEMLTDSIRALLLEACGYRVRLIEFIATEHTARNRMLVAQRNPQAQPPARFLEQLAQLKQFYGIRQQTLETLLREEALLPPEPLREPNPTRTALDTSAAT